MKDKIEVQASSGNVFLDLGLKNADELLVKAEFAHKINRIMTQYGLTPTTVAYFLDIEQPQVLDLINGKAWIFSTQQLREFFNTLERLEKTWLDYYGLPDDHKELIKVKLATEITKLITQHRLTQGKAAEILGTKQPQVSELINGKLYKFSTDRLFRFLIRLSEYIVGLNQLDNYSRSESARVAGQVMKSPYSIEVDSLQKF